MNSVQQQCEHHHQKVLIESFHLSGHTFWFSLDSSGFRSFLGLVKFIFGSGRVNSEDQKIATTFTSRNHKSKPYELYTLNSLVLQYDMPATLHIKTLTA